MNFGTYCILKDEKGKNFIAEQLFCFEKIELDCLLEGQMNLFYARKKLYSSDQNLSGDKVITQNEKGEYNHYNLDEREKINSDEQIILEGVSIPEAKKLTGIIFWECCEKFKKD